MGIILLYFKTIGTPVIRQKSDFGTAERFFINSLNLFTKLNCCLVQHNGSCCLIRNLFPKHIKVISYADN